MKLDRKLTKDEVAHKAVLLTDGNGTSLEDAVGGGPVNVLAGGKRYTASVSRLYLDGALKKALSFKNDDDDNSTFYFEQGLAAGKHIRLSLIPHEGDALTLEAEVYQKTA